jgi:hypothetical protein
LKIPLLYVKITNCLLIFRAGSPEPEPPGGFAHKSLGLKRFPDDPKLAALAAKQKALTLAKSGGGRPRALSGPLVFGLTFKRPTLTARGRVRAFLSFGPKIGEFRSYGRPFAPYFHLSQD